MRAGQLPMLSRKGNVCCLYSNNQGNLIAVQLDCDLDKLATTYKTKDYFGKIGLLKIWSCEKNPDALYKGL